MEEPSVDEGQQPVGDTLAQAPPGPPKAAPLPPLPHKCSELAEHGPRQQQQQWRGQPWGDTGVRTGGFLGNWEGLGVGEGRGEHPGVWGETPSKVPVGQGQDTWCLGRGSGEVQMWGAAGWGEVFWGVQGVCKGFEGLGCLGGLRRDTGFWGDPSEGGVPQQGEVGSHRRGGSSPRPSAAPRGHRGVAPAPTSPLPAAPAPWPWGLWGDLGGKWESLGSRIWGSSAVWVSRAWGSHRPLEGLGGHG